ncbi:phage portal protein, SPP1 family [Caloranaerobacter azorensis DSM 13643]|uniref:Phage portal protein, SPP1 family n=1 Tax=Caloranaerobacter azorensis DSM 13643 TaxID=1121264 RepID=A0A1M5TWI2_9FIRM|nr:phage portal protein [Caloranaerobacter azorensis]SHH54743.1 phage portal protein, SPP1 family [Caloranaerobacter azorensis DSM 13643]
MLIFDNSVNMLTKEEIIKIFIDEFNASKERKMMLDGERYYRVENDILNRKMIRYEDEKPVIDETKTNNRLAHGFMHLLVDDKVNYLLSKPYTLTCDDEKYLEAVKQTLGKRFQKKLTQLGTEASNKGIAWLHVYIDGSGQFKTMKIPSEQCVPIWKDNDHEELQALIRYYDIEVYEGKEKKIVTKIEYWTSETVDYYVMENGEVILDSEMYLDGENNYDGHFKVNDEPGSWERVPFIPFKNNDYELPDLQFIKTLIDNYDLTRSDIANELEDIKNVIYVLKGYGGQDPSEFMRDLSYYRMIKVDADEKAGVDKIETTINIEAAKEHYETLKKDIYDFGQGVDKSQDKLGNNPSGIALRFMYSGLDLKCNAMEDNFKWAFEQLIYFVNKYLEITKQPVSDKEIKIVFNRDIAINESQAIIDCQNSKGIISDKTIIANHPWVEDVDNEIEQIEKESKTNELPMFDEE